MVSMPEVVKYVYRRASIGQLGKCLAPNEGIRALKMENKESDDAKAALTWVHNIFSSYEQKKKCVGTLA